MAGPVATGASGGVQSVERAFQLLDILAAAGGELSISELAHRSGLPLPTIHRLVRTLARTGHVRQQADRRYSLGPQLIVLGESASRMLGAWAQPHLLDLAETVGETANMAILDGERAVYVAQVPSRHSMRMFTEVGRRVHLHSTGVGKALLAQMSDAAARAIVTRAGMPAMTPQTITDPDALLAELDMIRRRGYAVDDGEQEMGVRCVAVPVTSAPSLTTISVSGPDTRLTISEIAQVAPAVIDVARRFAVQLGG